MVCKTDFDLSLEAPGEPGYWDNRDQNNERIVEHYGYLVGTVFTDVLCQELSQKIGRPVRGRGNRVVLLNSDRCRLNLDMNEYNVITKLSFG